MGSPGPRLRYGRLLVASTSALTTLVAIVGGITGDPVAHGPGDAAGDGGGRAELVSRPVPHSRPARTPSPSATSQPTSQPTAPGPSLAAPPAGSGQGRRVVFDLSAQHVWLVGADERVVRSYPVSGSLTDNLHPGSYAVYSRSPVAYGVDDSGTMRYFVRFTHGAHAAIGFHSIPVKDGRPLQTPAQLGTPQSHGCVRQALPDARALWAFAPVGTRVVVTA